MSTSLAMPGPPVLVWMSHHALDKELLRSTTLTLYVYSYAAALALQAGAGAMSPATWTLAGLLAPFAVAGAFVGHRLSPRLGHAAFQRIVLGGLLATGLWMLWQVA